MSASLYFYDLETSGVNPKKDRVMQFAGQRTNLDLEPIQDPDVFYVKMTDDVLPDPGAILVTGITPQQTISDGISEKEFADFIYNKVAIPQTTIVGYNSVRFDNEFIRFLLYRNYFDAYEWSYKNNVSVWDLLDVVRMTRALRPDGIKWPFASDGKPTNRLEKLTDINKIDHIGAHDALSDVKATIGVAKLIKKHQPKLFSYLYDMRSKQAVINLVNSGMPFVYTSGRYDANYQKTTVAINLCEHPVYGASRVIVYDLRYDPTEFLGLSIEKLIERMQFTKDKEALARVPVKALTINRCPAVAPITVLTGKAQKFISLNIKTIDKHLNILKSDPTFVGRITDALQQIHKKTQAHFLTEPLAVDAQLYDGFINDADKKTMAKVREYTAKTILDFNPSYYDERLSQLWLLYKARQFPQSLSEQEQVDYQRYKTDKMLAGGKDSDLAKYIADIQQRVQDINITPRNKSLLEDLYLWAEYINPSS